MVQNRDLWLEFMFIVDATPHGEFGEHNCACSHFFLARLPESGYGCAESGNLPGNCVCTMSSFGANWLSVGAVAMVCAQPLLADLPRRGPELVHQLNEAF